MEKKTLFYDTPQTEIIEFEMEQAVLQMSGEDGENNDPFNNNN